VNNRSHQERKKLDGEEGLGDPLSPKVSFPDKKVIVILAGD
jgi:hypothetical protein